MNKKEQILQLVREYIAEKHSEKTWTAGKDWVQYSGPVFDSEEYVASIDTLLNEWLVLGKDAITFEHKFPKLFNKSHGIVTNSGSSSNLIMMAAMQSKKLYNFPKGTKVIVPVAGFPTTLNPILQLGFEPAFVDIELDTLNLNLQHVEDAAKNGAKILTFAHVLGNPPNMNKVMEIVREYNLILLEDCCDALGSTYNGVPLGSFGDMASCSFYPAHHMTMGEGGFVACNTKEQELIIRSLREWGRGCFVKGTPINVNECIKNIEDIKVGDSVVTHLGNNKKVTKLFKKEYVGRKYTFNCKLKGNVSSTDYHPHLILKKNAIEPEWIESKNIDIGDCFLEKIPNENIDDQYFSWKYSTLYNEKIETLKAEPDLMRLIGYWLAEGCINMGLKGKWKYSKGNIYYAYRVSFHFNSNETDYIIDVNNLMLKYFGVSGFPGRKKFKGNSKDICFKSRKAYEFFDQHFSKLSYNKTLPKNMVNWKNSLTSELIRGFWRGDGCYSDINKSFSIDSTSFILIEQIRRILLKHNIISSFHATKKEKRCKNQILNGKFINAKHDIYNISLYGINAELFSKHIINEYSIKARTNIQYAYIKNGYVLYPVRKICIEHIDEPVFNLEIEDDHSYHAHGISTHNCYCVGKKANLLVNGSCGCRFKNWLPSLPEEIFDHKYVYEEIGYNLKPIELQCSMGLKQLEKLPFIHKRRKENYNRLFEIFKKYEDFFILPRATELSDPSWFAFPLTIKAGAPFKRFDICKFLENKKIQTRNYFGGNLLFQPAYADLATIYNVNDYPVAKKVTTDTFFLGTSPVITPEQLDYIDENLKEFYGNI
jgi:dTDP-4-amino-4,6-dideoxygalactose transaminase